MHNNILIIDDLHQIFCQMLNGHFHCDYKPFFSLEETQKVINNYEGLVLRSKFNIDESFLRSTSNLKFIARAGSGTDNIDVTYAEKMGIKIINASEANKIAVAEHTIGLLLSLMNNIHLSNYEVKDSLWLREENRGTELSLKTVGIIGFGNIGSTFAKLLQNFNVKILAHDKYKHNFSNSYVYESTLENIFEEADILSLHIPLTQETKYYANSAFFNSFKKPIWFINTSRGKILVTNDLLQALNEKKIIAAGLDVLEQEPPKDAIWFNRLINSKKILLTPHVAGWSKESYKKISEVLAQKILQLYNYRTTH